MEINLSTDHELKSLCYVHILLPIIRRYIELTRAPLLSEDTARIGFLRKQSEVMLRVGDLPLANTMKIELSFLLSKMFTEIRSLWNSEMQVGFHRIDFLQIRYWNLDGTLNRKRIGKDIIQACNLIPKESFILALYCCLEEEACLHWHDMTLEDRSGLPCVDKFPNFFGNTFMEVYIWNRGYYRNVDAFSYRLQTLGDERRIKEVMRVAKRRRIIPEMMRFCLSQLDENQKKEVSISNPAAVLRSLFSWPYHHQFIQVANVLWDNLMNEEFCDIISNIRNDLQKYPDPAHVQILRYFWEDCPKPFKRYIAKEKKYAHLNRFFVHLEHVPRNSMILAIR